MDEIVGVSDIYDGDDTIWLAALRSMVSDGIKVGEVISLSNTMSGSQASITKGTDEAKRSKKLKNE